MSSFLNIRKVNGELFFKMQVVYDKKFVVHQELARISEETLKKFIIIR